MIAFLAAIYKSIGEIAIHSGLLFWKLRIKYLSIYWGFFFSWFPGVSSILDHSLCLKMLQIFHTSQLFLRLLNLNFYAKSNLFKASYIETISNLHKSFNKLTTLIPFTKTHLSLPFHPIYFIICTSILSTVLQVAWVYMLGPSPLNISMFPKNKDILLHNVTNFSK